MNILRARIYRPWISRDGTQGGVLEDFAYVTGDWVDAWWRKFWLVYTGSERP